VHRETATYALNELKAAGIIDIGRRRIHVIDRERLARAARTG
jgi:CRP-like cAMP-binding protein